MDCNWIYIIIIDSIIYSFFRIKIKLFLGNFQDLSNANILANGETFVWYKSLWKMTKMISKKMHTNPFYREAPSWNPPSYKPVNITKIY